MEYVDYEKLHKDTIAKLQEMVNSGKITVKTACGICADFVPESEDERIMKEIIELVMQPTWKTEKEFHRRKELCAWLEKQGEQKPSEDEDREYACQSSGHYTRRELMIYNLGIADGKRIIEDAIKETEQKNDWSDEDELKRSTLIHVVKRQQGSAIFEGLLLEELIDWLKSLKDRVQPQTKYEWSEEDKSIMESILSKLYSDENVNSDKYYKYHHWFKSLKDRYTWKPSTLQIEALESATENCAYSEYQDCLRELAKQLKKL